MSGPAGTPEPPRGLPSLFAVGEAAQRVGVSASTLRTWERRYGVNPAARSGGRHRRYSLADIQCLEQMRRLIDGGIPTGRAAAMTRDGGGAAPTARGSPWSLAGHGGPYARELAAAIMELQADAITTIVSAALDEWGAAATWRRLLSPTLRRVGELWSRTGCGVEIEHVASATIETVLRGYATRVLDTAPTGPRSAGCVVLAATPREAHTLPLSALAAALADQGLRSVVVGSLPTADLHAAIGTVRATAVVLWSQRSSTADPGALASARSVADVSTFVAGPGWASSTLSADTRHLASLTRALTELSHVAGRG
ncbi:MAG: MerR family transcriptional regulator [Nocardioidaceae bacterium]|nr:MerR family transcriptional regulator [Nocardioidaceae bacterium]